MSQTKHIRLSNQLQILGLVIMKNHRRSKGISTSDKLFIEKYANELSNRLPINTIINYSPSDPLNHLNHIQGNEILDYIDHQVQQKISQQTHIKTQLSKTYHLLTQLLLPGAILLILYIFYLIIKTP